MCALVLVQIFVLQPRYLDDLDSTVPLLVANLEEVSSRCVPR